MPVTTPESLQPLLEWLTSPSVSVDGSTYRPSVSLEVAAGGLSDRRFVGGIDHYDPPQSLDPPRPFRSTTVAVVAARLRGQAIHGEVGFGAPTANTVNVTIDLRDPVVVTLAFRLSDGRRRRVTLSGPDFTLTPDDDGTLPMRLMGFASDGHLYSVYLRRSSSTSGPEF